MSNNWYVITGGPSTGKTSLLAELQKQGHKTLPEAARTLIDEALGKGIPVESLRADEKHFQEDVARLKEKVETTNDKAVLTFFDRGMQDTLAYMRHYGFDIADWVNELMRASHYKSVFLLDPLSTYQDDYARTEDRDFGKHLHKLLTEAYAEFGMKPVRVPAVNLRDRVAFVLDKIKTGSMSREQKTNLH